MGDATTESSSGGDAANEGASDVTSGDGAMSCNGTTCTNGCCDSTGKCVMPSAQSTNACGTGGATCVSCGSGKACNSGVCTCDATSCPMGCCKGGATGTCEPYSAQATTSCGTGGATCAACSSGSACTNGTCSCGGMACAGCCNGTTCEALSSESNTSCGAGGVACQACGTNLECNKATGQCACDANSCAGGCCVGGATGTCELFSAQSNGSCGTGGTTCGGCASGQECDKSSGTCVCDATSCPTGCCTATAGGTCVAYTGQSTSSCGTGGAVCAACTPITNSTASCASGVCKDTCNQGYALCNGTCINTQSDNNNCGGCGLACPSGCAAGECLVTLASNLPGVNAIAINGIKAYVATNSASGNIYNLSLGGGGAVNLTPSYPQNQPTSIVLDNQYVYWTDYGSNQVMRMSLNGLVQPTVLQPGQTGAYGLAIDPSYLYWTQYNNGGPSNAMRVALSNPTGTPAVLLSGVNLPSFIAVDSTYAYITIESDDYVARVDLSTLAIAQITAFENNPYFLAIDSNNIYFTNEATSGDVRQSPKNGNSSTQGTVLSAANTMANGIATDGVNVYFTAGSSVYRCPVGVAGGAKAIATSQNGPSALAVDSTSVYWTNSGGGTVMKLTPK